MYCLLLRVFINRRHPVFQPEADPPLVEIYEIKKRYPLQQFHYTEKIKFYQAHWLFGHFSRIIR